jgi:hypothetical protein
MCTHNFECAYLFTNMCLLLSLLSRLQKEKPIMQCSLGWSFFSASSLRKQSAGGKHVSPLAQIILILSQSVFGLTSQCLVEKQQISIPITYLRFDRCLNPRGEHTNHYFTNAVYTSKCDLFSSWYSWKLIPCRKTTIIHSVVWKYDDLKVYLFSVQRRDNVHP